jgi:hypothetical protein
MWHTLNLTLSPPGCIPFSGWWAARGEGIFGPLLSKAPLRTFRTKVSCDGTHLAE